MNTTKGIGRNDKRKSRGEETGICLVDNEKSEGMDREVGE
jgi:hypothetical protein